MVVHLKDAASFHGSDKLSVGKYDEFRIMATQASNHTLPSSQAIIKRFDGWNNAINSASLNSTAPSGNSLRKWGDEEQILRYVRICADALGHIPSSNEYEAWRENIVSFDSPAVGTVRSYFGGHWSRVKEALQNASKQ